MAAKAKKITSLPDTAQPELPHQVRIYYTSSVASGFLDINRDHIDGQPLKKLVEDMTGVQPDYAGFEPPATMLDELRQTALAVMNSAIDTAILQVSIPAAGNVVFNSILQSSAAAHLIGSKKFENALSQLTIADAKSLKAAKSKADKASLNAEAILDAQAARLSTLVALIIWRDKATAQLEEAADVAAVQKFITNLPDNIARLLTP